MGNLFNLFMHDAMLRRRGFACGWGLLTGRNVPSLLLSDQGQEVGLKTCAIFFGVAQ